MSEHDNQNIDDEWASALSSAGRSGDSELADGMGRCARGAGGLLSTESVAAEWATMIDDGLDEDSPDLAGADRILNQEEIDQLVGFSLHELSASGAGGIRAIVDSGVISYERLPMLEIIFDRMIRLLSTSLRNFFQDNVEVTLDNITSVDTSPASLPGFMRRLSGSVCSRESKPG